MQVKKYIVKHVYHSLILPYSRIYLLDNAKSQKKITRIILKRQKETLLVPENHASGSKEQLLRTFLELKAGFIR